jgi:hypothetical protein
MSTGFGISPSTGTLAMQQIESIGLNKKTPNPECLLICKTKMVRLCLRLQNFSDASRIQRAYQSLHGIQDPIEAKYRTQWDNPLPKRRFSPSRRKMDIKDVAADYTAGQSLRELATKYGVDRKTVALRLRKSGVELRLPRCNLHVGPL